MNDKTWMGSNRIWINKKEWDLNEAWTKWRNATFKLPADSKEAKAHPLYKKVEEILSSIKE